MIEAPMPMSEHPHYADMAEMLRGALGGPRDHIEIMEPTAIAASYDVAVLDAPFPRRLLTRKRCAGLAPATIDARWEQARYVWDVLVDDVGRHIAGPARLEVGYR